MKNPDVGTKRILVVEDEPAICEVCQRVLTSEGFEVDIAVNGVVAQGMIAEKQYDLCLIDIRTPEMNGQELYQWLQGRHHPLADSAIFTSGSVFGPTMTFIEKTDRPFLPKPFTPDELRAIVREAFAEANK